MTTLQFPHSSKEIFNILQLIVLIFRPSILLFWFTLHGRQLILREKAQINWLYVTCSSNKQQDKVGN